MEQLECREIREIISDKGKLERFLEEELGVREYELVECEELLNDISWEATVEPEEGKPETWWTTNRKGEPCLKQFQTKKILNHLCWLGKVKPGSYLVRVSW